MNGENEKNTVKIKHLGIDFGSSSTAVVGFAEEFDTPILFEFQGEYCFRTAIAKLKENKTYLYSLAAINIKPELRDSYLLHSDIKEKIKIKEELARLYLTELLTQIKNTERGGVKYDFSSLESVCYGYPEYLYRRGKDDFMKVMSRLVPTIVKKVFGSKTKTVFGEGEPQLATVAYHLTNMKKSDYPIERGELILTLDFGGYTLDMSLLKADDGGVLKQIKSESCEVLPGGTGKTITKMICESVYADEVFDDGVDRAKIALYTNGEVDGVHLKYKKCGEQISLKYIENARGRIYDTITVTEHRDGVKGESHSIKVGDVYDSAAGIVSGFLENGTDEDSKKISHLLFTGGTSRIARMRDCVIERIRRWLDVNRSELHIDRYDDTKVFIGSSAVDRDAYGWRTEARVPLKAEYAVAYGAALVARDRDLLKNGRMPKQTVGTEAKGLAQKQRKYLEEKRTELKGILNEIRYGDIRTLDEVEARLERLYSELGTFPSK